MKRLSIRVSDDLMQKLAELAQEDQSTIARLVRIAIEAYLAKK